MLQAERQFPVQPLLVILYVADQFQEPTTQVHYFTVLVEYNSPYNICQNLISVTADTFPLMKETVVDNP